MCRFLLQIGALWDMGLVHCGICAIGVSYPSGNYYFQRPLLPPWFDNVNPSMALQCRHNERDSVSNHQPPNCLLNRLFKAQVRENIKAPRHWSLCGEFTGDRWIPRTKGQWRGKCFHLMTSSWISIHMPYNCTINVREWIRKLITSFTMYVITYPCWIKVNICPFKGT